MLSNTIEEGLQSYHIGEKLRSLRLKKKLGLVELGRHTGLSPGLLSKLERDLLFPTLPTLLRIALVYGVGLEYFFVDESQRHVVAVGRKKDRVQLPEKPDLKEVAYTFESLDFNAMERKSNAYFVEFHPTKSEEWRRHHHLGIEFIYVITGKLGMTIGQGNYVLESRDSIYFDSTVGHGYRCIGRKTCTAVLVSVP